MSMMMPGKLEHQTSAFFREHYDKVILALLALIFIIIILAAVVLYQVFHRPLPPFGLVMPNGKSMQLTPHDTPSLRPDTLITWGSKAAVAAYTFDFVNYKKQINDTRSYFTATGWADYQASIGGLIGTITANQLFVNGVVSGPPVISNQGELLPGQYAWRIQIPFLVTYQSSEKTVKTHYTMVITIIRVPTRENPRGVGINQLVMEK